MEPEGMTRACTIVPVIKRKARTTHSQDRSSRRRRWPGEGCGSRGASAATTVDSAASPFMAGGLRRHGAGVLGRRCCAAFDHFELDALGRVNARVAGSTEAAGGIVHGTPQA